MSSWNINISAGEFFLDFAWMGLLLVAATALRWKVPFFQKYLIPANLIAGALGLFIGMNGLQLIDLTSERLGVYVYHLLALLFIALGLRAPKKRLGITSIKFGLIFLAVYLVQAIVGLLLAFALFYTIMPDLFIGIGFLPPLAFGMNPGIAYTIGENWQQFGFESGGIVGLTFAAIGFVVAYTAGIWLVRRGIRKGEAAYIESGQALPEDVMTGIKRRPRPNMRERITTSSESIESLTFHIGLIGFTYILTFFIMKAMESGLIAVGAENEVSTLWSFHFIFAAIFAIAVRKTTDMMRISKVIDDMTMTRCSNLFMDFMIVASVAAISFVVVAAYWIPLLLISVTVALITGVLILYLTNDAFANYRLERFASIFGNMTGTLQSALVLLRILDPKMKSPVSFNLVYGSGFALVFGFPLLILINAPVHYFDDQVQGFWMVLAALMVYLLLIGVAWQFFRRNHYSSKS
jgi:glutamate:Na+ symporter, ESS family